MPGRGRRVPRGRGRPRAESLPPAERPERALLTLRRALGTFANLRPTQVDASLLPASALRPEVVRGCDFVIVRELTGGIFYGTPSVRDEVAGRAVDTMAYTVLEIERVARVAFELASRRSGGVTSVDKANVLEVSRLWRETVERVACDYPAVDLQHMYVDRAAMELVLAPARFDVILTGNLFGDILSDEAAAVCGSLGVLGSAGLATEARAPDEAVSTVLDEGLRTVDLTLDQTRPVGTAAFTDAVIEALA